MDDLYSKIDWDQLRQQKEWLIMQDSKMAWGLVHLLDAVQDDAVNHGHEAAKVFGE